MTDSSSQKSAASARHLPAGGDAGSSSLNLPPNEFDHLARPDVIAAKVGTLARKVWNVMECQKNSRLVYGLKQAIVVQIWPKERAHSVEDLLVECASLAKVWSRQSRA